MYRILLFTLLSNAFYPVQAQAPKFKMGPDGRSYFNSAFTNYAAEYYVQKKDSTGFLTKSKIHITEDGRQYLSFNDGNGEKAIYPDETLKISFLDKRISKRIEGIATADCWLFTLLTGKITLYSNFPPPQDLVNEVIFAMKIGEGTIEPFDPAKLRVTMLENKEALELFDKKNAWENNYIKAVKNFNKK